MSRKVSAVALIGLTGVAVIGGVFFAVTAGVAFLNDSVRGYMGASRAFEVQSAAAQGDLAELRAVLRAQPRLANARDEDGWTPLHEAARAGNVAVVNLLISRGAFVNARDDEGRTPLHAAVRADEPAVARLLLAHGADIHALDLSGHTPGFYAARSPIKTCAGLLKAGRARLSSRVVSIPPLLLR